jgi:hypothetical protein
MHAGATQQPSVGEHKSPLRRPKCGEPRFHYLTPDAVRFSITESRRGWRSRNSGVIAITFLDAFG